MASNFVYTGRWTDWSKPPAIRDQVTITAKSSNILTAFIAIFITFLGAMTWSIIAYVLHQRRVSKRAENGLHYQIQALLRNDFTPTTFSYKILRAGFAWKNELNKWTLLFTTFGFVLLALLIYAIFIAAGLLLSLVGSTGDVLLLSRHCGVRNLTQVQEASYVAQEQYALANDRFGTQQFDQAYAYAQVCYTAGVHEDNQQILEAPAANCQFYSKPLLNWTTSYPRICPFETGMCKGSSSDVVQLDTGFLDTHYDLGKNTAKEDRLQFRRITTCAPVVTEGFTDGFVDDPALGRVAIYDYGPNAIQSVAALERADFNHTFVYSYDSFLARDRAYSVMVASTESTQVETNEPGFAPVSQLVPANTSLTLLFLANRAIYPQLVSDPWFEATSKLPSNNTFVIYEGEMYYNEEPGTVLGCVDQVQLCNPNLKTNSCVDWNVQGTAYGRLTHQLTPLELNKHQEELVINIANSLTDSTLWTILYGLGEKALLANQYLGTANGIDSQILPSNQWMLELQFLQAVSMSLLQRMSYINVAGPTDPVLLQYFVSEPMNNLTWGCKLQKIQSEDYYSFSILGLCLIFGIGGAIILLSTFITLVIPKIQQRYGRGAYARLQWYANDVLRLQRLAFEDRHLGTWAGEPIADDDKVPTTTVKNEAFVSFSDVSSPGQSKDQDAQQGGADGQSSLDTQTSSTAILGLYGGNDAGQISGGNGTYEEYKDKSVLGNEEYNSGVHECGHVRSSEVRMR